MKLKKVRFENFPGRTLIPLSVFFFVSCAFLVSFLPLLFFVVKSSGTFWNQFRTPSPEIRKPHFLRFGLLELLLTKAVHLMKQGNVEVKQR